MAFSYANTSKSASQHMDEVMTRLKAKEAYLKDLRKQLFQKRSVNYSLRSFLVLPSTPT